MKRALLYKAQDRIIDGAVNEALIASEGGDEELAEAIREVATRLADRFGMREVGGLPKTFGR
jgi:hypothetical protein